MPFDRDSAIKARQTAELNRKAKQAAQAMTTLDDEVRAARREQEATKRGGATRYYIHTPLADAEPSLKSTAVKLEIQIPAGPTAYKDEKGNVVYREMGSVILLEGEGVTTDKLWAEYIEREYGREGWTVSEIGNQGIATYLQEIEEAKRDLAAQLGV